MANTWPELHSGTNFNYIWDAVGLEWIKQTAGGAAAAGAVTIADGADVVEGALADAAVTTDANGTVSAKLRGLVVWFTRIAQQHNTIANPTYSLQVGGADANGGTHRHVGASNSDASASSVGLFVRNISGMTSPGSAAPSILHVIAGRDPVSNAVRQVEVFTSTPAGTEGGVITRNIPSGTQPISAATLPLPTGAATESTLDTRTGSLTEAAPASDTASSGINGRLQRIAQRLTSLIALLPAALVGGRLDTNTGAWLGSTAPTVGQKTMANSVPVVLASDQASVPVAATLTAETTKVIGTVNQGTYFGKTITYVKVNQVAAGTTVLKVASASNKHKLLGAVLTMSAAGTLKFSDGVGDLTGPMDVATQGGFVLPTSILPFVETSTTNTALNLVTTVGFAQGVVAILTEP